MRFSMLCKGLILATFLLGFQQIEAKTQIYGYERVIFGAADLTVSDVDDVPEIDYHTFADPHNAKMLAIGGGSVYNEKNVNQMREDAFNYFKEIYGLDFQSGDYDQATDTYILPNALMVQMTRMFNAPMQFDSKHIGRNGKWTGYEVGELVIMKESGAFTGGLRKGLKYFAGDQLAKYTYNFVRPGRSWRSQAFREEVNGFPDWPSRQTANSFGSADSHGQIRIVDRHGHTGYLVSTVDRVKQLNGDWTINSRAIFTWQVKEGWEDLEEDEEDLMEILEEDNDG